jgi:hypothetical protein
MQPDQAEHLDIFFRIKRNVRKRLSVYPRAKNIVRITFKIFWWTSIIFPVRRYVLHKRHLAKLPHFNPPFHDFALEVPFRYESEAIQSSPSVAVLCHIYYESMTDWIKSYLYNIPFPFDLFITTDTEAKKKYIESRFKDGVPGKVEVRLSANRGRDIAPKLITLKDVYSKYEFVLHLHSKHSPYGYALEGWRDHLFNTLVGSKEIVQNVFEIFHQLPEIGMIAPQHYESVRQAIGWGHNYPNAKKLAQRLHFNIRKDGYLDFPTGSMFWARSKALQPLLKVDLQSEDFPQEKGQTDGTLAHSIERLYFFICEQAGYDWIKIALPQRLSESASRIFGVNRKEQLNDYIQHHLIRLQPSNENVHAPENRLMQYVYLHADPKTLDFEQFKQEVYKHARGIASLIDFDESFYLNQYPEVKSWIAQGKFLSGYIHYHLVGRNKGYIGSNSNLSNTFNLKPSIGIGQFAPLRDVNQPINPDMSMLPKSELPTLLILIFYLQEDLFFAGYRAFFNDFNPVFSLFSRVILSVEHTDFDRPLATQFNNKIEVIPASALASLSFRPTIILAYDHQLFHKARQMWNDLDHTIYYCQEYEAGFFPYGKDYIRAQQAVLQSKNIIVSTGLLLNFFKAHRLIQPSANVWVTNPSIEMFEVQPVKTNKLFFYYRPESFHSRNLAPLIESTVKSFCKINTGYEVYLVGTIATAYSYSEHGNKVFILNKLPLDTYRALISSCDVVVSLIYSAHPGVVAYQAAGSGIPTITNIFENRDAGVLREISSNLVPFDPLRDDLLDLVQHALTLTKGKRSFNVNVYGGSSTRSLQEYIELLME